MGEVMTKRCCANCVYSFCSLNDMISGFATGFGVQPVCSNHPDSPGQLREMLPGGICRNYRPKPADPNQTEGAVRRIYMAHGEFVLVDAADYEWLNKYKWSPRGSGRYAARREKGKTIYMHREIMNAPPGKVVDHADGNAPNNCRFNLRICTRGQNCRNQCKRIGCASQYKGVYRDSKSGKWFVQIKAAGSKKPLWFGYFDTEVEAARMYDRLAVEVFGDFAYLNFPQEWTPERRQEAHAKKEAIRAAQRAKAAREQARRKRGKGKKKNGRTAGKGRDKGDSRRASRDRTRRPR
jgi:hypothetical protein